LERCVAEWCETPPGISAAAEDNED
jgi:hypothetical protein